MSETSAEDDLDPPGPKTKDGSGPVPCAAARRYRHRLLTLDGKAPTLQGDVEGLSLRPGLDLHRARVRDLCDRQIGVTLERSLRVALVIEGEVEVSFGALDLHLKAGAPGPKATGCCGAVVALAQPEVFCRRGRRGRLESKVSVAMTDEWLDSGVLSDSRALERLRDFRNRHLAYLPWRPSPRALALAHQISEPPDLLAPFRHWYLEARTIEFAAEALTIIAQEAAPAPPKLLAREHRRMRELQAWIDARAAEPLSLEMLAREAAMSPAALQRAFRAFSGQSLFDYLRDRRLDLARQALERDGVSVARAAEIAGYAGANNFATAFKRRFACAPSAMRLRL